MWRFVRQLSGLTYPGDPKETSKLLRIGRLFEMIALFTDRALVWSKYQTMPISGKTTTFLSLRFQV